MDLPRTDPHRHMTWIDTGLVMVTVAAGTVVATASGNFWPTGRNSLMMVAAAVIVLFGVGVAWSLRSVLRCSHGRTSRGPVRSSNRLPPTCVPRRSAVTPTIFVSGRFDVDVAYDITVGEVYFHNARRWPLPYSNPGWVYSPDRAPWGIERLNLESIGTAGIGSAM